MPFGCFGKKKKKKGEDEHGASKEGPERGPSQLSAPQPDAKGPPEGESGKAAKKKDVIASDGGDDCALLGFRSTGSRPPSSYVDSPTSNSHPHTPSTVPALASSASSPASSIASSPTGAEGASCRAQLAQKRRDFFSEFYPRGELRGHLQPLPSTLPTAARARQFGKVRHMRPVSQPSSPDASVPEAPAPPGPHLLRPTPTPRSDHPKGADPSESGFASPDFLLELRSASDEISRRWAMSEEEREVTPSAIKVKAKTQKMPAVPSSQDSAGSPPYSSSPTATSYPLRSVDVVVTPPSPPSVEDPEEAPLSYPQPHRSPEGDGTYETKDEHTHPQHQHLPEKEPARDPRADDHDIHAHVHSGSPKISEEGALTPKQLSTAHKHDDDPFDLSDEPGDQEYLVQGAAHSDMREGEGAGTHPEHQRKESNTFSQTFPSPSTQLNHKGEEPSADTNINISSYSAMD